MKINRESAAKAALVIIFFLINVTTLLANDTFVHQSAGNLHFLQNDSVAIRSERLTIGPPTKKDIWSIPIHVEYQLENITDNPIDAMIGFPLPACNLNEYIWNKHFDFVSGSALTCVKEPSMKIYVDGQPVNNGNWDFVFLKNGKGLSNTKEDNEMAACARNLITTIRDPAIKFYQEDPQYLFAAQQLCKILNGRFADFKCAIFSSILVHRTYIWRHTFAPKRRISVVHDYVVQASGNISPEEQFHFDAFCLNDPAIRTAWHKYDSNPTGKETGQRQEFFTEYVLKTGALWATPIEEFELVIRKASINQRISTCFSGLEKTGPLEFKAHRKNFRPAEDLRILFFPTTNSR